MDEGEIPQGYSCFEEEDLFLVHSSDVLDHTDGDLGGCSFIPCCLDHEIILFGQELKRIFGLLLYLTLMS